MIFIYHNFNINQPIIIQYDKFLILLYSIVESMLPKRKLIKKRYKTLHQAPQQEQDQEKVEGILSKLKSIDKNLQYEAITILANLSFIPNTVNSEILSALINLLYQGDQSLIYSAIFALNNLCTLNLSITEQLFNQGLAKAFTQLDSSDTVLFKPMLIFMTTISESIPSQYSYLIAGAQNTVADQKYLTGPQKVLVLQFLAKSNYVFTKTNLLQILYVIADKDKTYKCRSLATIILLNSRTTENISKISEFFFEYLGQIITDLNLQDEYKLNIKPQKIEKSQKQQPEEDIMQEQVEEQLPKTNTNVGNNSAIYDIFVDTVEGIEYILEYIYELLDQQFEDQSDDGEQQIMQEKNTKKQETEVFECEITKQLKHSICQHLAEFKRNCKLSFIEGSIINQLSLRIVQKLPMDSVNAQIFFSEIACQAIINIMSASFPDQVIVMNLTVALNILLKCKRIQSPQLIIQLAQNLKLQPQWKSCWLCCLQLFSLFFNPQKHKVSIENNKRIGMVIKKLIVELPYIELQEWRGQAIDTLFDVYCNQDQDQNFKQLGFIGLLQQLYHVGKQQLTKNKKQKKFIKDVLTDIERFINYKKTHMK